MSQRQLYYFITHLRMMKSRSACDQYMQSQKGFQYVFGTYSISHATDLSVGSAWTPQLCRRNLTHSRCPSAAARCNGVRPSKSLTPRSWPRNMCLEKVDLLTVIDRVSFKIDTHLLRLLRSPAAAAYIMLTMVSPLLSYKMRRGLILLLNFVVLS